MKIRLVLLFLISQVFLNAQSVIISGVAENQPEKLIRLITYADQFSMLEKTVDSEQTAPDGSFEIEGIFEQAEMILIALDLKKGELVIEPGKTYDLRILQDTSDRGKSIYEQSPLRYEIINDKGLNYRLQEFNAMYNTFLLKNFNAIYRSRTNTIINEFWAETEKRFSDFTNKYFQDYVKYKIASLELAGRKKDENKLLQEYFLNNDILYNNIEYSSLFKEVFKNYLNSGQSGINYSQLEEIINYSTDFKLLDDAISSGNPLLSGDRRLRELIALVGLAKLYNTKGFYEKNIINYFRQVERNSTFSEHSKIAANYIIKLQKLSYGSKAPDIEMVDLDGQKVNLQNQDGRFTLLSFMKNDCNSCISYISMLDDIRQMFKGKLQNISLVKGSPSSIALFMDERDYEWPVLGVDNILLLEEYDVKVFPTYVLINPDGSIALTPTPMPDENLAAYINGFMKRWEGEKEKKK